MKSRCVQGFPSKPDSISMNDKWRGAFMTKRDLFQWLVLFQAELKPHVGDDYRNDLRFNPSKKAEDDGDLPMNVNFDLGISQGNQI